MASFQKKLQLTALIAVGLFCGPALLVLLALAEIFRGGAGTLVWLAAVMLLPVVLLYWYAWYRYLEMWSEEAIVFSGTLKGKAAGAVAVVMVAGGAFSWLLVSGGQTIQAGRAPVESERQWADQPKGFASLAVYVRQRPNSPHAAEALVRLQQLAEQRWKQLPSETDLALRATELEQVMVYLSGANKEAARRLLDETDWEIARTARDSSVETEWLMRYLQKHRDGAHGAEAEHRYTQLTR